MDADSKLIPLKEVNWLVQLPGYAEPFLSWNLHFSPDGRLRVNTKDGSLEFTRRDQFQVRVLDLDIPQEIREMMLEKGWVNQTMSEFIMFLVLITCEDD